MNGDNKRGVLVLGVGGVGEVVAKGLTRLPAVEAIIVADLSLSRAEMVAAKLHDSRVRALSVDARDVEAVYRAIPDDCAIVIHAGIPRFNLTVMEACLRAGVHYMDMAADGPVELPGLVTVQRQIREYHEKFQSAGLLALLGIGVDPGVTNILARWASDHLASLDEIVVYDGDNSMLKASYAFALPFSPDTSIEECLQPPLSYLNGSFVTGTALDTGIEVFDFPDPVGPLTVRSVSHEEAGTLPVFLPNKELVRCEFKYALPDEYINILRVLKTLGLDSEDAIDINGTKVVPRQVVTALLPTPTDLAHAFEGTSCVGTWVHGQTYDGDMVEWYLYTMGTHAASWRDMEANVTVWQAGLPSVIATELLFAGDIPERGALVPEQLNPEPWIQKLPQWNMPLFKRELRSTVLKRA
ncbi:MAG: hypothetical protein C7B44_12340 [Sulfobacillus thermosulfidooxidans]|uniref:Uncharacterized protein n=1 Tax=Sulfobacillus thermotolerans TaxID=338644 RepID=A0ABM6RV69_9FIRM|nr:saccharopine dehydrogenase NADP-binding domain-containing protein [Sulfobacillus sp. hq2]AUW95244.1 hypothetical protein BXT84_15835 [Sulfobacillus thermotolerans]MCY0908885.1 saccharopine dehydrogenase NADP-binding domain-containing protein [Sulfobacillus thermotolerans]POB10505.1 hypothetical protein CO251_09330 [Sulfobacillus sp. hq2]PSR35802.1 MAG: hypothetical protein C7B44_12340 [Sulfobacillus thermosulfidooxidans]